MTRVIKIAKPTKSITSTEPRDFILNSDFDTVIIYKEAERSVVIPANSSVKDTVMYTTPDGLTEISFPYVPIVELSIELTAGSGRWYDSPFTFTADSDPEETKIILDGLTDTAVEDDRFFITLYNKTGSQKTIKYRYYIYALLAE